MFRPTVRVQFFFSLLLAVLAGAITAFGFQENFWALTIIGLIIPIAQMSYSSRKLRILCIFLFAETWFLIHIHWMSVLGTDAWIALATLCTLPWLLFGVIRVPQKSPMTILLPVFAVITIEGVRSVIPWGGFPWGLIAYSQLDGPFVELARIGGSSLVSGVAVATSAAILLTLKFRATRFLLIPLAFILVNFAIPDSPIDQVMRVTAIQGNVPRSGLDLSAQREAVFGNHLKETEKYLSKVTSGELPKSDLIVWPESSTDIDPIPIGPVRSKINEVTDSAQTPLLVGAVTWGENPVAPRNAGILWAPESGPGKQYAKNHLVPFGEYIPLRELLTKYIGRLELVPIDYSPGIEPGIFQVGNFVVGDVICFEVAYGKQIRETVSLGAQIIAVQTNNATYGNTEQPEQQFAITRFRAIEHQRPFVVASTSGVSGLIDHNGRVIQRTEQFVAATVSGEVATVSQKPLTDRVPMWSAIVGIVGFLTMLLLEFTRPRRKAPNASNTIE